MVCGVVVEAQVLIFNGPISTSIGSYKLANSHSSVVMCTMYILLGSFSLNNFFFPFKWFYVIKIFKWKKAYCISFITSSFLKEIKCENFVDWKET